MPEKREVLAKYYTFINERRDKDRIINLSLNMQNNEERPGISKPPNKFMLKNFDIHNVEIKPWLIPFVCHMNAGFIEQEFHLTWHYGYSIYSCDCGNIISGICHSLKKIGDKFVDFTRDTEFTNIYFIDLGKCNNTLKERNVMQTKGSFRCVLKRCRCENIIWDDSECDRHIELKPCQLKDFF